MPNAKQSILGIITFTLDFLNNHDYALFTKTHVKIIHIYIEQRLLFTSN